MTTNLSVNGNRLWDTLMVSAGIGTGPRGGLRRLTLTEPDRLVRDQLRSWAAEGGYPLTVDGLGNMVLRRAGSEPDLPPVVIGSHLDTQWAGGRFDGILGVLAGLEVLRTLDDLGIATKRTIEVVNWTNEEGARFSPPMLCSLAWSGQATPDWVENRRDRDGIRFGDALDGIGYRGPEPVGGRTIDAYFELHIEQGPALDRAGVPVGIVTGGYPSCGMRIAVEGATAHTGPTPMGERHNALVGAAMVAVAVNDIGWAHADTDAKATAARLDLVPNLPGTLSEYAELFIDMRAPELETLETMKASLRAALPDCAARSLTQISIAEEWGFGVFSFDDGLIGTLRETAERLGIPTMDLRSQAGHDAYHVARVAPACMIFTPCRDGITHNEAEDISLEPTLPGVNLLLHAALARANR
ncbi:MULTISPECIES: Zn-dependent hydrolase [Methylobacterium]|jgi:N-carbamoyl-L-amino-acid hydrolase|uniref:Zn-dependent hydrolase n=1 Tax=Methylobacterium TaxID=407 RepID=UPI0008F351E4|nr:MULTISPECIES: Zn-dependent hydrolase [Methylobacterium]MBZ6415896.1 Zn-dependent hydrolase [Methylobacterium sp.]MBK3397552.1 Zn-dependent hydrolase [Methylobacterium ajmalii]MBK3411583.1 Zn-dependent hydrolase [Methylobacterium ajmalii]MBK3421821.1 Zn-dependent hydrolase [Methylobacterium ajmalii]SFF48602.1 N-carbamoyl-L-amino-acid hydrolase [Methylobacterium sp. yr596]